MLTAFSQETGSSTTTQISAEKLIQLVEASERAQREVVISRKSVDGLREQIQSKEKIIAELKKQGEISGEAILAQKSEITELRAAIASQQQTLKISEQKSEYLAGEVKKLEKKLRRSRKVAQIGFGAGAVAAIVLIITLLAN